MTLFTLLFAASFGFGSEGNQDKERMLQNRTDLMIIYQNALQLTMEDSSSFNFREAVRCAEDVFQFDDKIIEEYKTMEEAVAEANAMANATAEAAAKLEEQAQKSRKLLMASEDADLSQYVMYILIGAGAFILISIILLITLLAGGKKKKKLKKSVILSEKIAADAKKSAETAKAEAEKKIAEAETQFADIKTKLEEQVASLRSKESVFLNNKVTAEKELNEKRQVEVELRRQLAEMSSSLAEVTEKAETEKHNPVLQEELDSANLRIQQMKDELAQSRDLQQICNNLSQEKDELVQKISVLENQLAQNSNNVDFENQIAEMKQQISAKEEEMKNERDSLHIQIRELKEQTEDAGRYQNEIEELHKNIADLQITNDEVRSELDLAKNDNSAANAIYVLENENRKLAAELSALKATGATSENTSFELQAEPNNDSDTYIEALQKQISDLREELHLEKVRENELSQQVSQLMYGTPVLDMNSGSSEKNNSAEENEALLIRIADLENEIKRLKDQQNSRPEHSEGSGELEEKLENETIARKQAEEQLEYILVELKAITGIDFSLSTNKQ